MIAVGPHSLLFKVNQPYLRSQSGGWPRRRRAQSIRPLVLTCVHGTVPPHNQQTVLCCGRYTHTHILGRSSSDQDAASRQGLHAADLLCVALHTQGEESVSSGTPKMQSFGDGDAGPHCTYRVKGLHQVTPVIPKTKGTILSCNYQSPIKGKTMAGPIARVFQCTVLLQTPDQAFMSSNIPSAMTLAELPAQQQRVHAADRVWSERLASGLPAAR